MLEPKRPGIEIPDLVRIAFDSLRACPEPFDCAQGRLREGVNAAEPCQVSFLHQQQHAQAFKGARGEF